MVSVPYPSEGTAAGCGPNMTLTKEDLDQIAELINAAKIKPQEPTPTSSSSTKTSHESSLDLEGELISLTRKTKEELFKRHPWVRYALLHSNRLGSVPKDLSVIEDWVILRSIASYAKNNLDDSGKLTYIKSLLFIISKFNGLMIDDKLRPGRPSLLVRVIHKTDVLFESGEAVTDLMISEMIANIRFDDQIYAAGSSGFTQASRSGQRLRQGNSGSSSKSCNPFNSSAGCSRGNDCRFEHFCARHYKLFGKKLNHSEVDCRLQQDDESAINGLLNDAAQ